MNQDAGNGGETSGATSNATSGTASSAASGAVPAVPGVPQGDALSLDELVSICAVSREWVVERVEDGLLPANGLAAGSDVAIWRFTSSAVWRTRRMHTLERDFDAVPELAALAADLMEELERARARLRQAGLE